MADRFGNWVYDARTFVLRHEPKDWEVDLDQCVDSANVLDWIVQADGKTGTTPQDTRDLIRALSTILDLQRNYCPGGVEKKVNPRDAARDNGFGVTAG